MLYLFHSPECHVCHSVLDRIKELNLTDRFKLVNVYANMENYNLAEQYKVKHLPSFVSEAGKIVHAGVPSEEKLRELAEG